MQFGPWDLVIRYLFPGVWIIPVIASIFAWIGAVQFWRKWGPKLLARSAKAMPVVGGALASLPARLRVTWGELVFILLIPMSFLLPILAFQGGWAILRDKQRD